jgi:hypothetical protein
VVVASVEVRVDGDVLSGIEVYESGSGSFDLAAEYGSTHRRAEKMFFDSAEVRDRTSGRLLEFGVREVVDSLRAEPAWLDEFGELAAVGVTGFISPYLAGLTAPSDVAMIGRGVVSQRATTHLLVNVSIESVSQPVEVWVSDQNELVRIQYLTSGTDGTLLEVRLDFVGVEQRSLFDVVSIGSVTELELEAEAAAAAAEARRQAEAMEAAAREMEEAERERAAEAAELDAELSDDDTRKVGLWLNEFWWQPGDSDLPPGHEWLPGGRVLCADASPRMGMERYVRCLHVQATARETVCAAGTNLVAVLTDGRSTWNDWVAAADNLAASTTRTSARHMFFEYTADDTFALVGVDDEPLAGDAADSLAAFSRRGFGNLEEFFFLRSAWLISTLCSVDLEDAWPRALSVSLDEVLTQYHEVTVEDWRNGVGDDWLVGYVPFGAGASGEHVAELQRRLINTGWDVGRSGADGLFGPATGSAIGNLQYIGGAPTTEIVTLETLVILAWYSAELSADLVCPTTEELSVLFRAMGALGPGEELRVTDVRCARLSARPERYAAFSYQLPSGETGVVTHVESLSEGQFYPVVEAANWDAMCNELRERFDDNEEPGVFEALCRR